MNFDFNRTDHQVIFQSIRGIATVAGFAGIVLVFVEAGTSRFMTSLDRIAQASDLLQGLIG